MEGGGRATERRRRSPEGKRQVDGNGSRKKVKPEERSENEERNRKHRHTFLDDVVPQLTEKRGTTREEWMGMLFIYLSLFSVLFGINENRPRLEKCEAETKQR